VFSTSSMFLASGSPKLVWAQTQFHTLDRIQESFRIDGMNPLTLFDSETALNEFMIAIVNSISQFANLSTSAVYVTNIVGTSENTTQAEISMLYPMFHEVSSREFGLSFHGDMESVLGDSSLGSYGTLHSIWILFSSSNLPVDIPSSKSTNADTVRSQILMETFQENETAAFQNELALVAKVSKDFVVIDRITEAENNKDLIEVTVTFSQNTSSEYEVFAELLVISPSSVFIGTSFEDEMSQYHHHGSYQVWVMLRAANSEPDGGAANEQFALPLFASSNSNVSISSDPVMMAPGWDWIDTNPEFDIESNSPTQSSLDRPRPSLFQWSLGNWSACSVTCSGGFTNRSISCLDSSSNLVNKLLCPLPRPVDSQVCNTLPCKDSNSSFPQATTPETYSNTVSLSTTGFAIVLMGLAMSILIFIMCLVWGLSRRKPPHTFQQHQNAVVTDLLPDYLTVKSLRQQLPDPSKEVEIYVPPDDYETENPVYRRLRITSYPSVDPYNMALPVERGNQNPMFWNDED